MLNVAVFGVGRLGQAVISAAQANSSRSELEEDPHADEPQIRVVAAVDRRSDPTAGDRVASVPLYPCLDDAGREETIDVIVDSSRAEGLEEVLSYAVSKQVPLVVAATGHSPAQIEMLQEASERIPILRSSNLSVGVNVLRRLTEQATRMLGDVDTEIVEVHHRLKIDSPSGTALTLAQTIRDASDGDRPLVYGRRPDEVGVRGAEIGIHSVRGGTVVGEHTVTFLLDDEIVELRHVAQSRQVFGFGALKAAAYVANQSAGLYNMEDLLG